jgi:hypothetical protein
MKQEVAIVEYFSDEETRRAANVEVLQNVLKVLFFWVNEREEDIFDEEGEVNESEMSNYTDFLWSITCSMMAATGMKIIGKDETGKYVATLEPSTSVKDFLIKQDIGTDEDIYWDDILEDMEPDSGFENYDDYLMRN